MLTQCYSNYNTVHRRLQQWRRNGVLRDVLTDLANALRDEYALDENWMRIGMLYRRQLCVGQGRQQ